MNTKTVFILSTLYLIQNCNGEQEISDIASDENSAEKYNVHLEESSNDDNLFNTTLQFLERLCVCLNKTFFKSDSTVSEDHKHKISSKFIENDDVHKNIDNFICHDIKDNVIREIKEMKAADELSEVMANDNKTEFEDVLYTSFIRTQNIRTYFINEYSITKKASNFDTQDFSTIVILTIINDTPFHSKALANTKITKQELYNTLLKNNTMYIDIISTKSNSKIHDQSAQIKPYKAQLCNIKSIYTTIMNSKNDNNLKNYKILRRQNLIKIYIEVYNIKDQENLTKLCCKDDHSIETCNHSGIVIKSNKNFVSQKKDTTKMYRSIILRMKNLIKRYFGKSYKENECYLADRNKNKLDVIVKNKNVSLHSNELSRIKDKKCLDTSCEEDDKRIKSFVSSKNNILSNKITTALIQAPNDYGNIRQVLGNYQTNFNEEKYFGELHNIITEKIIKLPNMVVKGDITNCFNSTADTEETSTSGIISSNILKEPIDFDGVLKNESYALVKEEEESNYVGYEKAASINNHHVTEKNTESDFKPLNTSILRSQSMESPTTSTDLGDLTNQTITSHVFMPSANISIGSNTYAALRQFPQTVINIKTDKDSLRSAVFVESTTSSGTLFSESEDVVFEDILNNLSKKTNMSEIINNSIVMYNHDALSSNITKEPNDFYVIQRNDSYTLVKGQKELIKKLNNTTHGNQRISIKPSNSLTTLKLISTSTTRYVSGSKRLIMTSEANEKAASMDNVLHHVREKNIESDFKPLNTSILRSQSMESPITSTDLGDLSNQTITSHVIMPSTNISIGPNTYAALRQFPQTVNIKADKDSLRSTVFVESTTSSGTLFSESEDIGFEDILTNFSDKPNMSEIINNSVVMNNRSLASQELLSSTKNFDSMNQSRNENEESSTNDESLNTSLNKLYLQSADILTTLANVRNDTKDKISSKYYLNANATKNYKGSSTYKNNKKVEMLQFYGNDLSKPDLYILKDVTIVDKASHVDVVGITNRTVIFPPRLDTIISPYTENALGTRLNASQKKSLLTNYASAYTEKTEFRKNISIELPHTNATTAKEKVSRNKPKVNGELSESKTNISNKSELSNTILPIITVQTSLSYSVEGRLHARNHHKPRVTLVHEDSPVTSQAYVEMSPFIDILENLNEEKIVFQRSKEENNSSVNVVASNTTANEDQSYTVNLNRTFSIASEQAGLQKQNRFVKDENHTFLIFRTQSDFKLPPKRDKLNVQNSERSFANGNVTKISKPAKQVTLDWLNENNTRAVNLTNQASESLPKETVYSTAYYDVKLNKITNNKYDNFSTTEIICKIFDYNSNGKTLSNANSNFDSEHIKKNNKTIFLEPNTKPGFNIESNITKPSFSQITLNSMEEATTEISNVTSNTIKIEKHRKLIHVSEKRTTNLTDSVIISKSKTYKVINNSTSNVKENTNRTKNNKQINTLKNKINLTLRQENTLRQLHEIVTSVNRLQKYSKRTKSVFDSRFRVSTEKYFTKTTKLVDNKLTILTPQIKTESNTLKAIPMSSGQPADKVNKKIKYNTYEPSSYHIVRRDPVTEKFSLRRTTTSKFKTLQNKNKIQRDYKQTGKNKRTRNSNIKNIKLTSRLPRPNRKEKNYTFKITKLNSYSVTRSLKMEKSTPAYTPWSLWREIKPKINQLDYYDLQRNIIEKPFSDFELTTTIKPKKFKKRTRLNSKPSYFYYLNDEDNFDYDTDIMLINEEGVYKETTQKINDPEKLELDKKYQQQSKPKYIQNRINPIKRYLYNSEYIKTTPSVNTFIRERNNMKYYNSLEDPFNYYNPVNSKYTTTYETIAGERRRPTRAYKRYF